MKALHTLLNTASSEQAERLLFTCCAAKRWVKGVVQQRPFATSEGVLICARQVWAKMERADVLQAFEGHPQIGGDLAVLRAKYGASNAEKSIAEKWSAQEQADVARASDEVLLRLRDGNAAYLQRFGYIFIVCASGKTATQLCELLEARLHNPPELEFEIAAHEQEKILLLRLQKLAS